MDNEKLEKLILKFKTLRTTIGNNNKDLSLAYLDEIESMLNIDEKQCVKAIAFNQINEALKSLGLNEKQRLEVRKFLRKKLRTSIWFATA